MTLRIARCLPGAVEAKQGAEDERLRVRVSVRVGVRVGVLGLGLGC